MPVKFSRTGTGNADFNWNGRETIPGEKTFLSTIIGDIHSNKTSYFTDICVNQISTPDIAGQVLTIDCSLNVLGNISYKDTGGSQQYLLAIIADLSGKLHDLSGQVDGLGGGGTTFNQLNDFIKDSDIPFKPHSINVGTSNIDCSTIFVNSRLKVSSTVNWYDTGYRGKLWSGKVHFHTSEANSYSNSVQNTSYIYFADGAWSGTGSRPVYNQGHKLAPQNSGLTNPQLLSEPIGVFKF